MTHNSSSTPDNDIRWKQRFKNFEKAFFLLERALKIKNPSEAERGGIIQFYEVSFDLSWKLLKDYLYEQGFRLTSPRESIKQAFQSNIIEDGHVWLDALEDRNLTTHTYNEETSKAVIESIRTLYFLMLKQLYDLMLKEINT